MTSPNSHSSGRSATPIKEQMISNTGVFPSVTEKDAVLHIHLDAIKRLERRVADKK